MKINCIGVLRNHDLNEYYYLSRYTSKEGWRRERLGRHLVLRLIRNKKGAATCLRDWRDCRGLLLLSTPYSRKTRERNKSDWHRSSNGNPRKASSRQRKIHKAARLGDNHLSPYLIRWTLIARKITRSRLLFEIEGTLAAHSQKGRMHSDQVLFSLPCSLTYSEDGPISSPYVGAISAREYHSRPFLPMFNTKKEGIDSPDI